MSDTPDKFTVAIHLSPVERELLVAGLSVWSGSAYINSAVCGLLAVKDEDELLETTGRVIHILEADGPLRRIDWARALLSAELAFGSDLLGSGVEWQIVTGLGDHQTLDVLRGVQRKFVREVGPRDLE